MTLLTTMISKPDQLIVFKPVCCAQWWNHWTCTQRIKSATWLLVTFASTEITNDFDILIMIFKAKLQKKLNGQTRFTFL